MTIWTRYAAGDGARGNILRPAVSAGTVLRQPDWYVDAGDYSWWREEFASGSWHKVPRIYSHVDYVQGAYCFRADDGNNLNRMPRTQFISPETTVLTHSYPYHLTQLQSDRLVIAWGGRYDGLNVSYSDNDGVSWTDIFVSSNDWFTKRPLLLTSGRILLFSIYEPAIGYDVVYCHYSDDDGESWTSVTVAADILTSRVGDSFLLSDGTILLTVDGTHSGVGECVYKSTDGGATWTLLYDTAVMPSRLARIWTSYGVVLSSGRLVLYYSDEIHTSDDNGLTWTARTGAGSPAGLAVVGDTLYRCKGGGNVIEVSTDGGTTWSDFSTVTGASSLSALAANGQRWQ